jgi:hypothetical protein
MKKLIEIKKFQMQKLSGKNLKLKANDIRVDIIKMLLEAKSGTA